MDWLVRLANPAVFEAGLAKLRIYVEQANMKSQYNLIRSARSVSAIAHWRRLPTLLLAATLSFGGLPLPSYAQDFTQATEDAEVEDTEDSQQG
ncbi:MAG: hypothetical protein HC886_21510 [Leptolyngbyaceae cyanobacterium SM1_1_3]|nr:hypothetical protein [Leptolyngbyaceae cyanobacterium SM1_1_3]NJN03606.1 hypothetical protein [Leptolyngbyaceae cyanobacterium RM1_1_2]NJO11999.1 hypothetical protein [Leptolyngbyaceae cyanobacterium SL_1_1]